MTAKKIFIVLFLSITLSVALSFLSMQTAQAQGCTDAIGASIECPSPTPAPREETATPMPPTENKDDDDTGGKENTPVPPASTSTSTPTPSPVATLVTIANPTDDAGIDGNSWTGTCSGSPKEVTHCIGVFTNGCEHVGGSADGTVEKDGKVKMTCTIPTNAQPVPTITTLDGDSADIPNPAAFATVPSLDGESTTGGETGLEGENELSTSAANPNDTTCHDMLCVMDIYIGCWWSGGNYSEEANPDGSISVSCDPKSGSDPVNPIPYPGLPLLGLGALILTAIAIPVFLRYQKGRKPEQPEPRSGFTRKEHVLLNKEDDGGRAGDGASSGDFDGNGEVTPPDLASGSGRDVIVSRDDKDKE